MGMDHGYGSWVWIMGYGSHVGPGHGSGLYISLCSHISLHTYIHMIFYTCISIVDLVDILMHQDATSPTGLLWPVLDEALADLHEGLDGLVPVKFGKCIAHTHGGRWMFPILAVEALWPMQTWHVWKTLQLIRIRV